MTTKELQKQIGQLQVSLMNEQHLVRSLRGCLERSERECEALAKQAGELRRKVLRVEGVITDREHMHFTMDVTQFFTFSHANRLKFAKVAVVEAVAQLMNNVTPERELLKMLRED